jgi:choloylglycine hydrolase
MTGEGLIVVNKRNVSKTAIAVSNPVKWTSKFGSISFNQWGCEFPCRGMNETGLAIGEMTLPGTKFPEPDVRPSLNLEQWIQYQLDNSATVEEVIASDEVLRLDPTAYSSHFFVADSSGNCVTMEWMNGRLVYHTKESLPVKVITNSTYESLIEFYAQKTPHPEDDYCTFARFYRAANMLENYNSSMNGHALKYGWDILSSVTSDHTKWMLLFDVKNRIAYFKTDTNDNIRFAYLKSYNFSCASPVKILDVNANVSGDIHEYFIDYSFESNLELIKKMADICGPVTGIVPESFVQSSAAYPETTGCNQGNNKK